MLPPTKSLLLFCLSLLLPPSYAEQRLNLNSENSNPAERKSRFMVFPHDREFVYKTIDDCELKCFVYEPEGHNAKQDKAPSIVLFFGGGWVGGTTDQASAFCDFFSKHGMVSIAADYRVKSRGAKTPKDCVKDAKSAIRWIKANHIKLGIDPEKVVVGGFSAGGHIAAAAGTDIKFEEETDDLSISAKPAALVLYNPVYDNGPEGYGHDRVKDYWKEFSPMHNLDKDTPPTIVFFGDQDQHVSMDTAKDYQKTMRDLGVRSDLHIYEGKPHGFMNLPSNGKGNPHFDITTKEVAKFLKELGLIK